MKFVSSHDEKLSKESQEHLFNVRGEITNGESEKVFAKALKIELGDNKTQEKYFIRIFNSTPLDPFGPEANRDIWNRTELRLVSKRTFDDYHNYLVTRNRIFWTKTNRGYING